MTIPYERTRAVLQTRDLLKELAIGHGSVYPDTLRRRAEALLRHFPEPFHIDISAAASPSIWAPSDAHW
ncbi:MAG TPA: BPSL0761 family protein [Paraburkholderia sp.]|uniref:BPSL0761 family protein n=1 Tax=Paraburkholderia sp. TaxID=1926495 RepID=UPI002B4623BD|nr:BPSL0761 family protein [Paraburkholderia sp.]HKR40308.1 BPSL0761 family protein [Paraburkholderia sp.]